MQIWGERLRALRTGARIPQALMARWMKVSRPTYASWERGAVPSVLVFARLADFFDVSVAYLSGLRDTPERGIFLVPEERALLITFRNLSPGARLMAQRSLEDLQQFDSIQARGS